MMTLLRRVCWLMSLLVIWCALQTPLWAQGGAAADDGASEGLQGRYALGYGLVILGVILGLLNVCRPGKRKGDPKKPT
jgi:hypothetical protein